MIIVSIARAAAVIQVDLQRQEASLVVWRLANGVAAVLVQLEVVGRVISENPQARIHTACSPRLVSAARYGGLRWDDRFERGPYALSEVGRGDYCPFAFAHIGVE